MENNKFCLLCGEELQEGTNTFEHHPFKKMCVNCAFSEFKENNYFCQNDDNKNITINKIKEAAGSVTESYKLVNIDIDIEPLPLKKPTSKCKHWTLSEEVKNKLETLFK